MSKLEKQVESLEKPKPTIRLTSDELSDLKDVSINEELVLDDVKVKVVRLDVPDRWEIKEMGYKKDQIMATLEITTKDIKIKK